MEPASQSIAHIATIERIEEKFRQINWAKNSEGLTTYDSISLGWYVLFAGASESIRLFDNEPDWKVGDKIKITYQKE